MKAAQVQAGVDLLLGIIGLQLILFGKSKGIRESNFAQWLLVLLALAYVRSSPSPIPYFRHFFQLAAHNDDQSSARWHWLKVFGPRTSSCLGPLHHAAFPAKITRLARDLPIRLLLWEESPNSSNFTPPNPEINAGEQRK